MTQGAVKTTGKRSRAVSAKKKAILSAALDTFLNSVFTAQGWADRGVGGCFKKPICCITVKRGAVYSRTAADSRLSGWHR